MNKSMFIPVTLALLTGCSGKFLYTEPTPAKYDTSININKPIEQVWAKLIPALSKSFFVVNNIDKQSGFINVSYSGDPEKYIDCGNIHYEVTNAAGSRTYDFPGARASARYETMNVNAPIPLWRHNRTMGLDGRINIVLEIAPESGTMITVNAKYVVAKSINSVAASGQTNSMNETISFNSNGGTRFPQGQTYCVATGKMESDLLELIKGM